MDKSPDAFRTISEVAELLDTPAHVLRFWESRFPQIKPVKRAGGRRYYRPADVELLTGIRKLLHDDGLTIRGVQKVLREQGVRHVSGLTGDDDDDLDFVQEQKPRSTDPIPLFPAAKPPVAANPTPKDQTLIDDAVALGSTEAQNPAVDPEPVSLPDAAPAPIAVSGAATGHDDILGKPASPADSLLDRDVPQGSPHHPATQPDRDKTAPHLPLAPEAAKPDTASAQDVAATNSLDATENDNIFVESEFVDAEGGPEETVDDDTTDLASPKSDTPSREAAAPPPVTRKMEPDAMTDAPHAAPRSKPALPVLNVSDIHAEWLPADLRALNNGAFGAKQPQAEALLQRLEALRNRVGDLGRVPRR
ncbi:MerR family transcriptional regulator [Pseudorhodobacter sp. W20_MBD10_FR17]|uniref:MerR family transcriptional regulator n=1 Tax=Pseudorhodobacter sp. W20_MBD10_FR17 TaxID=3240266 RepID=UPI003F99DB7C